MSKRTALLITPTLDEVKKAALVIHLPEREAIRFFNFYESKGWMVGKNRMVSFKGALENWKLGWEDRGRPGPARNGEAQSMEPAKPSGMDKMIAQKEFERISERMKTIKNGYGEMQSWTRSDAQEYNRLLARKKELRIILGITI